MKEVKEQNEKKIADLVSSRCHGKTNLNLPVQRLIHLRWQSSSKRLLFINSDFIV